MSMELLKEWTPDPALESQRVELAEVTLGPLINTHLRWNTIDFSPTAKLSDKQYGHLPEKFGPIQKPKVRNQKEVEYFGDNESIRPGQEPLKFRAIAGQVLGIDPESLSFEDRVRAIDGHSDLTRYKTDGWYTHLEIVEGLDITEVIAIKEASEIAFDVSALTERNVPEYKHKTMGQILKMAEQHGMSLPALTEWFNGLWIAEEGAHDKGQYDYGTIRRFVTSPEHIAGDASILRTPIDVDTSHFFGMFVYTTFQEFATVLAHRRNAPLMGPVGNRLQTEESQDESKHFGVYGDISAAAYSDDRFTEEIIILTYLLSIDPFMPGSKGIPLFRDKTAKIAKSKIYSEDQRHESMRKTLERIGMLKKESGAPGGERYIDPPHISELAQTLLNQLRTTYDKEPVVRRRSGAFVLGQTIDIEDFRKFHKNYAEAKDLPKLTTSRINLPA